MRASDRLKTVMSAALPGVQVRQIVVAHSGDDASNWNLIHEISEVRVSVASHNGEFPFLIENSINDIRMTTSNLEDTILVVKLLFGLKGRPGSAGSRAELENYLAAVPSIPPIETDQNR